MCSVQAIQFDCQFEMKIQYRNGTEYGCNDAVVNNSGAGFLENVSGHHQEGKSYEDVRFFLIFGQYLPLFPRRIAEFFKNLDALTIHSSSLRSISAKDLRPFSRLLYLSLFGNQLTSIDGDLFRYTPHLQYINLGQNKIQHIGHGLVNNLNNLQILYLMENVCINRYAYIQAGVLSIAPQLSVLCPPLDATTTEPKNNKAPPRSNQVPRQDDDDDDESKTTSEITLDQCMCDEKIRALEIQIDNQNQKIDLQSEEINQLQQSNEQLIFEIAAFEKRFLEVEMKLLKVESMPEFYNVK